MVLRIDTAYRDYYKRSVPVLFWWKRCVEEIRLRTWFGYFLIFCLTVAQLSVPFNLISLGEGTFLIVHSFLTSFFYSRWQERLYLLSPYTKILKMISIALALCTGFQIVIGFLVGKWRSEISIVTVFYFWFFWCLLVPTGLGLRHSSCFVFLGWVICLQIWRLSIGSV